TTGAFTGTLTGHAGLSAAALGLTVFGRTTVLVRTEGDVFEALKDMPTMVDCATMGYLLPPIRYPDGHSYLKLGVGTPYDPRCDTLASLQACFKGPGAASDRDAFTARLKTLFPVLAGCEHWHTDTCAVTKTASGLPIIDFAGDDRVAVAVGGNGKGAKGSDEWGRIAADLVAGRAWSSPVAREKLAFPGARATAPAVAAQ
ncbi:MAG: FAD-dependent oxidoreductase, partial [Pseudomonadota bacterium]